MLVRRASVPAPVAITESARARAESGASLHAAMTRPRVGSNASASAAGRALSPALSLSSLRAARPRRPRPACVFAAHGSGIGQVVRLLARIGVDRGRTCARAYAGRESALAAAERVERVAAERDGDGEPGGVRGRAQLARAARAHAVRRVVGVVEHVRRAPHRVLHAPARRAAPARALRARDQLVLALGHFPARSRHAHSLWPAARARVPYAVRAARRFRAVSHAAFRVRVQVPHGEGRAGRRHGGAARRGARAAPAHWDGEGVPARERRVRAAAVRRGAGDPCPPGRARRGRIILGDEDTAEAAHKCTFG
jgi:hypothetical protein